MDSPIVYAILGTALLILVIVVAKQQRKLRICQELWRRNEWKAKHEALEEKHFALLNQFDRKVEMETLRRLKEWDPGPSILEDVRHAEKMALMRETRDAGRKTPPRTDAGPNAKIHKIKMNRSHKGDGRTI